MEKKTLFTVIGIFALIIVIVGSATSFFSMKNLPFTGETDTQNESDIKSFDACVEKGFPVIEGYPPKCVTSDGKIFTQTTSQIANPASEYCIENAGRIEIRKDLQGEVGYCVFEDGKECEEWAFFNNECSK